MSRHLQSDVDLAEEFGLTVAKFHELRRRHNWPHVRIDRFTFRFTEQQVEQIVAAMTVSPSRAPGAGKGLTERSARRSA